MPDLRQLEPGTEIVVNTYIQLRGSQRLVGGNVLQIQGSRPKTGAMKLGLWIPPALRDTGKEDQEWKPLELNGEEVERLGRLSSMIQPA